MCCGISVASWFGLSQIFNFEDGWVRKIAALLDGVSPCVRLIVLLTIPLEIKVPPPERERRLCICHKSPALHDYAMSYYAKKKIRYVVIVRTICVKKLLKTQTTKTATVVDSIR